MMVSAAAAGIMLMTTAAAGAVVGVAVATRHSEANTSNAILGMTGLCTLENHVVRNGDTPKIEVRVPYRV